MLFANDCRKSVKWSIVILVGFRAQLTECLTVNWAVVSALIDFVSSWLLV